MIIAKKYFTLALLLGYSTFLFSQTPIVVPLDYNPALRDRKPVALNSESLNKLKNGIDTDTVILPFFDDFSYYSRSSQPDQRLWMDQNVFINNSYPILPRSNGVATFDALDANGEIYQNTTSTFSADTLSSRPIDLGVHHLKNVYLSFFYQPGGYGDSPDPGDSLILQFKSPVTEKWRTVWHIPGTSVHPFKQVLLPIEGEYLYKGFQFRFMNLVSLDQDKHNLGRRGNADHWHIDYVYLGENRSVTDTAYYDVAVIAPMKTLIKGYQSIPWKQLPYAIAYNNKLEPVIEITYRNNNNISHSVDRSFTVTDVYNNITNQLTPTGNHPIEAGEIITFKQNIINPFESVSVDSASFIIKGYLGTDEYDRKENDTVSFHYFFKNYFARDDGTPENGYGFSGYNAQGRAIACRYETFIPDTLQAIQIYFNSTANDETKHYKFKIAVWRDDNGRPGEQVYLSSTEYSPKTTGRFTQFNIEKQIIVTKYYWIGWVQVTTGFLNVGFDQNYNDKGNLWYNNGFWQQDFNEGTLMIRPIMGNRKDFFTSTELPETVTNTRMKVYPNPASHHIRIEVETGLSDYDIEIYGVTGQLLYREPFTSDDIDVSSFEQGLYVVRLVHRKSENIHTQKLLIIR